MPHATILIVDDEQLIRWSLASRLKDEGYRTLEAATAAEALSQHREGVDLVLLDIGLARGFTDTSLAALQTPVLIIAAGQPDPVQPQDKESQVVFGHLAPSISD